MTYIDFIYTPEELSNPDAWIRKAGSYHAASVYLLEKHQTEVVDGEPLENISLILNAISATPYLTALALELYMKGYLVLKGYDIKSIKSFNHNIENLRVECMGIDERWNNNSLCFVCDKLGKYIMGVKDEKWTSGGNRYPQIRDLPIYFEEFKDALVAALTIVKDR